MAIENVGATRSSWLAAAAATLAVFGAGAQEGAEVKWHPGHYMLVYLGESQATRLRHLEKIGNEPVIQGAQIRYRWVDLEPRKDVYDFSAIEKDLQKLQSSGKRLVIQIMDRRFNTKSPDGVVPNYLLTEAEYNGGLAPTRKGFIARIWEPAVMDRQIALYRALGARFDREPYVEGITGEETTPSFGTNPPPGYTNADLGKQLGRLIEAHRSAWPHTQLFLYPNFLSGQVPKLVALCAASACGIGGPDVLPPPDDGTEGDRVLLGRTGGTDYRGRLTVAYAIQTPALGGSKGNFKPQELFEHAYSTLRANYLFWSRNTSIGGPGQQWDTGILPFIRSIDGKINTECPRSLQGRCSQGGRALAAASDAPSARPVQAPTVDPSAPAAESAPEPGASERRQPHRGVLRE